VDDTLALVRDLSDATDLLTCLNEAHPSIQFTMQVATNDRLPFIGMEIIKIDGSLETRVYRKKTNKGLLLLYQSHVDSRYFTAKNNVRPRKTLVVYARIPFARIFSKLKYPGSYQSPPASCRPSSNTIRQPFKDQKSADVVRRQLGHLGTKINQQLQPVFTNKKIADHLRVIEKSLP